LLARTSNRKPLIVQEILDAEHAFYIHAAVHALASPALGWFELRELSLPETQDVAGQTTKTAHLTDPKIELVGDDDLAGSGFLHNTLCKLMHPEIQRRGG